MATSFILTDGTTEIQLVYDAASQTTYKLRYGAAINSGGVNPRWFNGDDAPPVLTDLTDANRQAFLTLKVEGASRDTVLNNIATIKRWVDGADQQAARYWLENKTTPRIDLKVQLNGTTNATLHPVIYGEVDDSETHYSSVSEFNSIAYNVSIMLMLAPYGEAETDVTLRNDLPSSPSMIEDSNGDGLADGLTNVNTPTFSGDLTNWLIGGVCQKFTTDAVTTHGWRTNAVTASTSSNAVAYAWVYTASATYDTLSIQLTDGSDNTIATKSHVPSAPTGYDKTVTDSAGGTWYRYSVTGSNTVAADFRLKVVRYSTNATIISVYLVDAIYLEINQTVVPDAWCSSSTLYNRYDPSNTSATTRQYINYIDVWGIPGDADALARYKLVASSLNAGGNPQFVHGASLKSGNFDAATFEHWIEGEDGTGFSSIGLSFSTPADATRSGGAYARSTGTGAVGAGGWTYSFTGDALKKLCSTVWQAYGLIRSSSTSATFGLTERATARYINVESEEINVENANTWELHYLGIVNGLGQAVEDAPDSLTSAAFLSVTTGTLPTPQTADIDFILLLPVQSVDQNILLETSIFSDVWDSGADDTLYISGISKSAYLSTAFTPIPATQGGLWAIPSGNITTRHIFTTYGTSYLVTPYTLTDTWKTSITYRARTRHLLGTS